MVKNFSGTVHNQGFGYHIDLVVDDGFVTEIQGHLPPAIIAEIERQRIKHDTNDIIALPNLNKGWTIFNMAKQRVAFTDDARFLAVEVNGKYEL